MKYKDALIPKTVSDMKASINVTMLYAPKRKFDDFSCDFDGAFYSLELGAKNLRKKLGDVKADQILAMLAQAKVHYEMSDDPLGGALLEDTKMVVLNRQPWAYPKHLFRWDIDASAPKLSEADLLKRDWEDDQTSQ
jgi:hypothetical protein